MLSEPLLILVFTAYLIAAGFRWRVIRSKTSADLEAYTLDRRSVPTWRASLSLAASMNAVHVPWLTAGLIAIGGLAAAWGFWAAGAALIVISYVFFGAWRRMGVITDAEFSELRYSGSVGSAARKIKAALYGGVLAPLLIATVFLASLRIFEAFLPWNEWIPAGLYTSLLDLVRTGSFSLSDGITGRDSMIHTTDGLITAFLFSALLSIYVLPGGFRATSRTDVAQFILSGAASSILMLELSGKAGGISALAGEVSRIYGHITASSLLALVPGWHVFTSVVFPVAAVFAVIGSGADGTGFAAQRALASRTDIGACRAGVGAAYLLVLFQSLIWLVIGVALLVIYPYPEYAPSVPGFMRARELLVATSVHEHVAPELRGVVLTGLIAALLATIDTLVSWGAAYWARDFGESASSLRRGRTASFLILIAGIVLAVAVPSLRSAWNAAVIIAAGTAGPLLIRWFWRGFNAYGEISALLITFTAGGIILALPAGTGENPTIAPVILAASTSVSVLVSWGSRHFRGGTKDYADFARFERLAFGATPAIVHLRRSLLQAGVCCVSLLLIHLGIVKLLFARATEPVFLAGVAVVSGLALIPVWMRGLR